ncbi:hypothetical protein [Comamonas odontotermitis]
MLAPIALVVGGVGDDWPKLGRWFFGWIGRLLERRVDRIGGDGGNQ